MITADILALQNRFVDLWDNGVPVFYDLQTNEARPVDALWCRFSVIPGGSKHYLGDREHGYKLQLGRVWLQVFIPEQSGTADAFNLIEKFTTIFRNWRTDEILCETEQLNGATRDEETGMAMMTVSIPWQSIRPY